MIKNVIQSITNNVKLYGDKTALINGEKKFTYKDVESMSNKVCRYLTEMSIGKEQVVAVYMDRSYLSVISVLGILKAGAAFLPIDIKTPIKRVHFMTEISKAKCIITDSHFVNDTEACSIPMINIHDILSFSEETSVCAKIETYSLAYILFTSGSTGLPKGAMVEHGGMNNHLSEKIRILHLSEKSIVAHNASISFDVSVWQILAPLCVGATIVIYPEQSIINLRSFVSILYENKVQVLEVVPTYLSLLIHEMKNYSDGFKDLKYLISTGEVLTRQLVDRCFDILPDITLINAYGPTEASDDITHCIIHKNDNYDPIPIGKPINNAEITIVRPDGSICGVNEPGELLVSGICVGRGYVGNNDETKLCFQYNSGTNKWTYRTGDLASLGDDGNYYFHDRLDTQIAFHGKRIEVKEIENIMLKFEGINTSAVVYDSTNQQINAFYISDIDIDTTRLRDFLKTLLPLHMIPTFIIRIDKMPVGISGKTDYDALNKMLDISKTNTILEEYTPEEKNLLQIIMNIVGIGQLPEDENWKDDLRIIGYNSINAIKLIIEIEKIYDIKIEDDELIPEVLYDYNALKKLIGVI